MNSTLKRVLFGMVLVVVGVLAWNVSTEFQTHERSVAFSDFLAEVNSGKVEQVTIAGQEIAGIYRADNEHFRTYVPSQYEGLAKKLIERGILVTATDPTQSSLTSWLYALAPILLLIGVLILFVRQRPGGGNTLLSFGQSKATLVSNSQKKVTFQDVAGVDEASKELQEIIAFENPRESGVKSRECGTIFLDGLSHRRSRSSISHAELKIFGLEGPSSETLKNRP